ncbi:MAG: DUF6175 family protein [Prevotella sp.]|nr:DUF6175 family protein [Prevotella sp.]
MKKTILFTIILSVCTIICYAQAGQVSAKKPRIMVRPAETWCAANGYMQQNDDQGTVELTPNYEVALQTSQDLNLAIAKIEGQMNERGYSTVNFLTSIRGVKAQAARNSGMTSKTTGSGLAVSFMDEINMQAKADILFDVDWKVSTTGPKKTVSYTLSAYDAYTYNSIASVSGSGQPSISAEVPALVEEAVLNNMDTFLSQLQQYFDDCLQNGRGVALIINCFDDGSSIDMETEYNGKELREIIEDWVSDNAIGRSYDIVDDTETSMTFQDVKIALFDESERPQDAGTFGRDLRKYLTSLGIPSKQGGSRTLGRFELIIGEK